MRGRRRDGSRTSKRIALALAVAGAATALAAPPAHATDHDCTIMGPYYVEEVVDCAFFVLERAVNW